jgi:hypothetical protein
MNRLERVDAKRPGEVSTLPLDEILTPSLPDSFHSYGTGREWLRMTDGVGRCIELFVVFVFIGTYL